MAVADGHRLGRTIDRLLFKSDPSPLISNHARERGGPGKRGRALRSYKARRIFLWKSSEEMR